MKKRYSNIETEALMAFMALPKKQQTAVRDEMVTDMFVDMYKQGIRNELIYDRIMKSFGFNNQISIFRSFKLRKVIAEIEAGKR
jgi:hypothetical protein